VHSIIHLHTHEHTIIRLIKVWLDLDRSCDFTVWDVYFHFCQCLGIFSVQLI